MRICSFTIATANEPILDEFDAFIKKHPNIFKSESKTKNGGLRSSALVFLMKFVVEHPQEFARICATSEGQYDLFDEALNKKLAT